MLYNKKMKNNKLTASEIIEKFIELNYKVNDFAFNELDRDELIDHNLDYDEVDQYGGTGQGDTWYAIKYFPQHDVYIKVDGWYSSYNGTNFDGWGHDVYEVRPKEKTITVYE